jgi:hypothetical protein
MLAFQIAYDGWIVLAVSLREYWTLLLNDTSLWSSRESASESAKR